MKILIIAILAVMVVALMFKVKKVNNEISKHKVEKIEQRVKNTYESNVKENPLTIGEIKRRKQLAAELTPKQVQQAKIEEERQRERKKELDRYLEIQNMPESEFELKVARINEKIESETKRAIEKSNRGSSKSFNPGSPIMKNVISGDVPAGVLFPSQFIVEESDSVEEVQNTSSEEEPKPFMSFQRF